MKRRGRLSPSGFLQSAIVESRIKSAATTQEAHEIPVRSVRLANRGKTNQDVSPPALMATSEHSGNDPSPFHYRGRWLQIVSRDLVKARTQAGLER
jgi:hypothetical protein